MPNIQGDPSNTAPIIQYPKRNLPPDLIARRAYENWEKAGRPHGRDRQFWAEAEAQLSAEATRREAQARRFGEEHEQEYPGRRKKSQAPAYPFAEPDPIPKPLGPIHIHKGAPFDSEKHDAFLAGAHASVDSSWLTATQYIAEERWLKVWFRSGQGVKVDNISLQEASSFFSAPSLGQWYWDHVLGRGYQLGSRSGSLKNWELI